MGEAFANKLPEVISVNSTTNDDGFEADVSEEEDRNRLIAYLLESKSQIKTLVFNQPFMMEPSKPNEAATGSKRLEEKIKQERVAKMKQDVSILVETPLMLNTDLLDNGLLADGCRIV